MNTELVVNIEQDLLEQAKQYADDQKTDLSQIVANYLQNLLQNTKKDTAKANNQTKKRQLGFMKGEINVPDDTNLLC